MKTVRSVLIVDDNPADIEITGYYLNASGRYHHILSASDGKEALDLFRNRDLSYEQFPDQFPPTLLLLDINMPRMNGFELLDAYSRLDRKAEDSVVIVMLSSSQYPSDIERANQYELVKGYLSKPFTLAHADKLADDFGEH